MSTETPWKKSDPVGGWERYANDLAEECEHTKKVLSDEKFELELELVRSNTKVIVATTRAETAEARAEAAEAALLRFQQQQQQFLEYPYLPLPFNACGRPYVPPMWSFVPPSNSQQ